MTNEEKIKEIREECEQDGETLTGVILGSAELILKRKDVLFLLDLLEERTKKLEDAIWRERESRLRAVGLEMALEKHQSAFEAAVIGLRAIKIFKEDAVGISENALMAVEDILD